MSSAIERRRSAIEEELRALLSSSGGVDEADVRGFVAGRPCFDGQVFLTMADGLGDDARVPASDLVLIAAALELLALQTDVHRRAAERHRRHDVRPTRDVLLGDLLESRSFELIAAIDTDPELVECAFALVVEATRSVQEGRSIVLLSEENAVDVDAVDARRIGALTGCAVELAALVTRTQRSGRRIASSTTRGPTAVLGDSPPCDRVAERTVPTDGPRNGTRPAHGTLCCPTRVRTGRSAGVVGARRRQRARGFG
jgi:geranylgeranyl pyrophosphate synthase